MSIEEFLALPEKPGVKRERIQGELVEMSTGRWNHERVKANINRKLTTFVETNLPRAIVTPETCYHLTEDDSLIPDVAVILSGTPDVDHAGRVTSAPDIVVEVVSSEPARRLQEKIEIYLRSGVKAIWVFYPELRIITVHRQGSVTKLEAGQTLEEPELLPGFSVPVVAFFEGV
jgi:Uma2 family endonuclease